LRAVVGVFVPIAVIRTIFDNESTLLIPFSEFEVTEKRDSGYALKGVSR
jgi:hypothetical protein